MEPPRDRECFSFEAKIPCGDASSETEDECLAVTLALEMLESDDLEGSIVWDTGIMFARLLMEETKYPNHFFTPQRSFIELGSGCGLVGLVAALRGAQVTFTDMGGVLPRLQRNVEHNLTHLSERMPAVVEKLPLAVEASRHARVCKLDWTTSEEDLAAIAATADGEGDTSRTYLAYDVVLATDCVYQESLAKPLLDTLLAVTGPKSIVLLGMRARFGWQADFLYELNAWFSGMPVKPEERHVAGLTQADDLLALRLRRRSGRLVREEAVGTEAS